MEIARASRSRGKGGEPKRQRAYQRLLTITGQVVRQANVFQNRLGKWADVQDECDSCNRNWIA